MVINLLDTSQSAYIFRQQLTLSILLSALTAGLVLYFLFRISRKKPDANRPHRTVYTNIFLALITVITYLLFFFPLFRDTIGLQQRSIETVGSTLRWVDLGDGQRHIEYTFQIDGTTFVNQGEVVYGGTEIEGVVCPGGRYVVIYDKKQPENSVIDLKRPAFQHNGQL